MTQTTRTELWKALEAAREEFRSAQYWTQRRDLCEDMMWTARQARSVLAEAAGGDDPDVKHWGQRYLDQIVKEDDDTFEASLHLLEKYRQVALEGASPSGDQPGPKNEEAPGETAGDGARPTCESILEWAKTYAKDNNGVSRPTARGVALNLPAGGGARRQHVYFDFSGRDSADEPILMIYSFCGKAGAGAGTWALTANAKLKYGFYGLIEQKGEPMLVMILRRHAREWDLQLMGKQIQYVAEKADEAEKRISPGEDKH